MSISAALLVLILHHPGPAEVVPAEVVPAEVVLGAVDVDGDGQSDRLVFHGAADGSRAILHATSTTGALMRTPRTSPVYPAWKAVAGRIDASGKDLVVLGIWTTKRTRPGDPPKKTIWVVGLDGARWVERWRGSMLARPFDDFTLRDLDGDGTAELVVRECAPDHPHGFTAYRWQGFGFDGLARMPHPCTADAPTPWDRLTLSGGRLQWLD